MRELIYCFANCTTITNDICKLGSEIVTCKTKAGNTKTKMIPAVILNKEATGCKGSTRSARCNPTPEQIEFSTIRLPNN